MLVQLDVSCALSEFPQPHLAFGVEVGHRPSPTSNKNSPKNARGKKKEKKKKKERIKIVTTKDWR
jgi:hypothetical protein